MCMYNRDRQDVYYTRNGLRPTAPALYNNYCVGEIYDYMYT